MIQSFRRFTFLALIVSCALTALPRTALADHSWGGYHWARTSNPFTVHLGDNVSNAWDSYLSTASTDWTKSRVLNTTVDAGQAENANVKSCRPPDGRVEVCNSAYGYNQWLGIATIWLSGEHITKGSVRVNDSYFNSSTYNTPAWRRLVMCQEVGHTFGLDHQDETFDNPNLGTCMDYTSDPDGPPSNEHPNAHDYEELEIIYAHFDDTTTVAQLGGPGNGQGRGQGELHAAPPAMDQIDLDGPGQWGRLVRQSPDGRNALYELDFGGGHKIFTFVIWALESAE